MMPKRTGKACQLGRRGALDVHGRQKRRNLAGRDLAREDCVQQVPRLLERQVLSL